MCIRDRVSTQSTGSKILSMKRVGCTARWFTPKHTVLRLSQNYVQQYYLSSGAKPGATHDILKVPTEDTIFAKIVSGEIPCKKVYEDGTTLAFHDIAPKAPVHILVIPKKPIGGISSMKQDEEGILGHMMYVAKEVAQAQGIDESGYRLVINDGEHGQQSVHWLHVHIIGGRQLAWPPG
eukprot:TRINITY_DN6298_c0_g1_i1.p1 TRINITY_DN6298_c0_g1~~TRINITY_DN6298_c0_g1_i1.p1  ORF type:complete len:179 (-),score=25.49 TRINITY_DN6298_c0_g1_i1:62-598(-)